MASRRWWFSLVALVLFVAFVSADTLNMYTSPSDLQYFDFATPKYATFGIYVQPCSQQDCCGASSCNSASTQPTASCAGHAYCGTDAQNNCIQNQDENITVNVLLGLEFACCYSNDLASGSTQCGNTGGQVGGWITTTLPAVSFTLPFKKCYNYPTDDASSAATWQFVSTDNLNDLIMKGKTALCPSNALGWTLALSKGYNRAVAFPAVADITWSGNNKVDLLYFYGHFGISNTKAPVVPANTPSTSWNGPSGGIAGGLTCIPQTQAPPPTLAPNAQTGCTGSCGCYFINLLNKTQTGTLQNPMTTYTFQVCVLCKFGFSYLQICNADGLPASNGGGGSLCPVTLSNLTKDGCQTLKWAVASSGCSNFMNGACDIFTVTIAGISDGYVFYFEGHAGGGTDTYPVTIDTSICTCGSQCIQTTPPATTTAATTTPAPTTTAPPQTDTNGSILPTTTPAATTTPAPTTTAPPQTDTNGSILPTTTPPPSTTPQVTYSCPDKYSAGPNCDCIYTDGTAAQQAWCEPDGSGGYVWKLEYPADVPNPPSSKGWYKPGTTDGQGYNLSCNCQKKIVNCPTDCKDANCICNTAKGVCVHDPVCDIVIVTPPPGQQCDACPKDAAGNECSNHGVCNCGTCVCGSAAGVNYTGADCSQVAGCPQFTDCATCRTAGLALGCVWCNTGLSARCLTDGGCAEVGRAVDCSGQVVFVENPCPNNCSNHGICSTSGNITQCICKKGFHGADCGAKGGLSAAAKAAAISAGVIAAIVICGVIVLVIVSFAAKKGVDWIQLHNEASAKSNQSPIYVDNNTGGNSGLYEGK